EAAGRADLAPGVLSLRRAEPRAKQLVGAVEQVDLHRGKIPGMALPVPESRAAHAAQIALFRQASPQRRFALARSLSATTIELSRAAIRRRHPDWTERQVLLEFARVHYGSELADRLRGYLERR